MTFAHRVVLILLTSFLPTSIAQSPTVTLSTGSYRGNTRYPNTFPKSVDVFQGIPFAEPPIGPLRFAPPQVPRPVNGTKPQFRAKLPPACFQNGGSSKLPESEDCLYLNVYAPTISNEAGKKVVMVWLYGGGLQYGAASQPLYDGTYLAANQDVIVVVPNYRLNIFGFPGEILGIPPKDRNLGLLDQRLALAWVRENIDRFGGDPTKITLFGESAGARSANFHLLTMKDPPFRAVIMQSGSAELTPLADIKKANESAKKGPALVQLAQAMNCTDEKLALECMRKVSAKSIKQKMTELALYSGSVEDGGFAAVKDQAAIRRVQGAANVPVLMGTNADELRGSMRRWKERTLTDYLKDTLDDNPDMKAKLGKAYTPGPDSPYKSDFDAISAIGTDMSFNCITAREARISADSGYPTWRYLFNASYPNTEKFPGGGANHGHEIQFVFGILPDGSTPEEKALSEMMQKTWADFAKNPDTGPGWDKVGFPGERDLGQFMRDGTMMPGSPQQLDRNCNLFESMYIGRA